MKLVRGTREELLAGIQSVIDALEPDAAVALAYNRDTSSLNFGNRKLIRIMDDCNGLLSKQFPSGCAPEEYDGSAISLAVLGIGYRGQIGFNEVGTLYSSGIHEQKLTASTREEFSSYGEVGETGTTLGIRTILSSDRIIVAAFGKEREDAVFGMLYGRNDGTVPAAFLQLHTDVTVYADDAAASKC